MDQIELGGQTQFYRQNRITGECFTATSSDVSTANLSEFQAVADGR